MCGITGWISNYPCKDALKKVKRMCSCIANRGPDYQGCHIIEPSTDVNCQVALGHTRLSIIDLCETGNQPMVDSSGRYFIVFNGEIYNHQEIRKKLRKFDISYKGTSDTEVLLYSYIHFGEKCLNYFNGMFAFAIYDMELEEMFIARDRVGVKPLYFTSSNNFFAFSSDPASLYIYLENEMEIDQYALSEYLSYGYIGQSRSIFKKIEKVNPGTYLRISKFDKKYVTYWDLNKDRIKTIEKGIEYGENDLVTSIRTIFEDSVKIRLEASDVPVGVFLSGGIDSSLVAAAASRTNRDVKTFSIGFDQKEYDESCYADAIAKYLNTDHHSFIIGEKDFLEAIDIYSGAFSEPFSDSSGIAVLILSKMTKEYVKVALSGDGGDEQYFGYTTYQHFQKIKNMYLVPYVIRAVVGKAYLFGTSNFDKKMKMFQLTQKRYQDCLQLFMNLLSEGTLSTKLTEVIKRVEYGMLSDENLWMLFDFLNYMVDDVLVKVDRASMRYGLEVRNPLLDYRFVEHSFYKIPLQMKTVGHKYLLKKLLSQYLPTELYKRPKKGFSIPLKKWVNMDLRKKMQEMFKRNSVLDFYIDKNELLKLSSNPKFSETKYGSILLWRIYLFYLWENNYYLKQ